MILNEMVVSDDNFVLRHGERYYLTITAKFTGQDGEWFEFETDDGFSHLLYADSSSVEIELYED